MITSVKTLPPGSITIFEVERDELGNEVYTGEFFTVNPVTKETLSSPVPPTYNTPPAPKKTSDPNSLSVTVKDGMTFRDGEKRIIEARPGIISGWNSPEAVYESDDANATTQGPVSGYSAALELSDFDFSEIPNDAVITGIRVRVERSKI